ncbi:MAG: ribonuclease III [Chloroflexi bacterium]|nr:ribonuclease III [Chloroflexota bacterium]
MDWELVEKNLGAKFKKRALLEQALIHRSYRNENPDSPLGNNERLEYLGDAVLGLAVAQALYERFPEMEEGDLSQLRSFLVQRDTLAKIAENRKLGDFLFLGVGEEHTGGRKRPRLLSSALEAVAGAYFLDKGYVAARRLIQAWLRTELRRTLQGKGAADYKSRLQAQLQEEYQIIPSYRVAESKGPAHERVFVVEALAGKNFLGRGSGSSKQRAEQAAAQAALKVLDKGEAAIPLIVSAKRRQKPN